MNRQHLETKKKQAKVHASPPIATILVILALPEELTYFHRVLKGRSGWEVPSARSRFACQYRSEHGLVTVVVQTLQGMGNIEASLLAGASIAQASPSLVLLVGLAGSLAPKTVQLGDVVISNQAKLYSSDKVKAFSSSPPAAGIRNYRFSDQPAFGHDDIQVDRRDAIMSRSFLRYERRFVESTAVDELISQLELQLRPVVEAMDRVDAHCVPSALRDAYRDRDNPQLHSGWILASQHVVDSAEYRDYLVNKDLDLSLDVHRQTGEPGRSAWKPGGLLAVDMESYGLLRAVELLRGTPAAQGGVQELLGGIVIRGISDLCEEKAESDHHSGQRTREVAVKNATETALQIVELLDYARLA